MKNKLAAKEAFQSIHEKLKIELNLLPLDNQDRTKAHGFAVGKEDGKQFLLILGNNEGAKQTRIITEKISDLPEITGVTHKTDQYNGSRIKQEKTSLGYNNHLKNGNQSSFIIDDPDALEQFIRWYANGDTDSELKTTKVIEINSLSKLRELSNDDSLINDSQSNDILDITNQAIDSTTKQQLIQARLGQGKFRQNVIKIWGIGESCLLTGIDVKQLLIASHIIPWRESDNTQRISGSNGIMLCSHFDKLFDQHLMSFDDLGQLVLSKRLSKDVVKHLENIGIHASMKLNTSNLKDENSIDIFNNLSVHRQCMANLDY